MNLYSRYKRLTVWNKIAFWGSVASLVGFVWSLIVYYQPTGGEPVIEISYKIPKGIFIRNIGIGEARDVQFYPMLYSITKKGEIHDRFIPSQPSLQLDKLYPGKEAEVSKLNYMNLRDFSQVEYPTAGYQGPFLTTVVTYHGANGKHLAHEIFQFFGPEEALLIPVPLTYAPGVKIKGDFKILDKTLKLIKQDIILAFHG